MENMEVSHVQPRDPGIPSSMADTMAGLQKIQKGSGGRG